MVFNTDVSVSVAFGVCNSTRSQLVGMHKDTSPPLSSVVCVYLDALNLKTGRYCHTCLLFVFNYRQLPVVGLKSC